MTWRIYPVENSHAMRVHCSGSISIDDLTIMAIEICFLAKKQECKAILVDVSEATLLFPTKELSRLLDLYAEYRMDVATRSALVLSTKDWPENFAKVVATAKEYGYSMDLLLGEQQVKVWLST